MHILLAGRGIMHSRDVYLKFLETKMFPWKRINLKTGKEEISVVQGALRPIEFFEYVFPEESLPEVLTMLGHADGVKNDFGGWKGKYAADVIRKMLGYEKIPNIPASKSAPFMPTNLCYGVNALGIKKDKRHKWEEMGYEQEML